VSACSSRRDDFFSLSTLLSKWGDPLLTSTAEYIIITQGGRPRGVPNEDYVPVDKRSKDTVFGINRTLRILRRGRPSTFRNRRIIEWRKRRIAAFKSEHAYFGDSP